MTIKVSIMTNKSYPKWKAVEHEMEVDETKTSYGWVFEDIEKKFKHEDAEYLLSMEYEIL